MVGEIIGQIRKIAITASSRKDHMFLGINVDRNGCITRENLRALCEKLHLPADDDIVEAVSVSSPNCQPVSVGKFYKPIANNAKWCRSLDKPNSAAGFPPHPCVG